MAARKQLVPRAVDTVQTLTGAAATVNLFSDVTTGTINIGGGLTSGTLALGNGSTSGIMQTLFNQVNIGKTNLQQIIFGAGATNHAIEMGRQDGSASTPYIDFHTGATVVDYDARIYAYGGNGSSGNGGVAFYAKDLVLSNDSNSPQLTIVNNSASGYRPAYLFMTRCGVSGAATPNNVSIAQIVADGRDSTAASTSFGQMEFSVGTVVTGGAPTTRTDRLSSGSGGLVDVMQLDGSNKQTSFFGTIDAVAGTTTMAPISLAAGTNKTTPAQGDLEFDGNILSIVGSTSGPKRQTIVARQFKKLPSAGSAIAAGTDIFPSNRPMMLANRYYYYRIWVQFTKNTAGTVTFQLKNSAAATATYVASMKLLPNGAALPAVGYIANANNYAATATFPATPSLTASATYYLTIDGYCLPVADTRLSIAPSAYGAGTISTVPGGTFLMIEDLGPDGQGNFG